VRVKAEHIAGVAPKKARRYVEAYCRYVTRGTPDHGLKVMSPEMLEGQREDPDLQRAGVVADVMAEFRGGPILHRLLIWIHADGLNIESFPVLEPGHSWPDELRKLAAGVHPSLYVALVYRLFMEQVELAASLYELEVLESNRVWVEIEGRFIPS